MEPYRLSARAEVNPPHAVALRGGDPGDISRSWQRCRMAGLTPEQNRRDVPHYGQAERGIAAERNAVLISQARPVISYFYSQIKDSGCVLLLSDANGYLLEAAGDTDFCGRAAKVALTTGACWAEDQRGTNAIGTALIEGKPVVVNGAEHYLKRNNFLACAAAPLTGPGGQLLGIIDISCDARIYHPHTFGLVRAAAQMIENRIFEIAFLHHTRLRFHISRDCVGSMVEGAIALGGDGKILGANRAGFAMLGLRPADIGTRDAAGCFDTSLTRLMDLDREAQGRPVCIRLRNGTMMFMSIETFNAPLVHPPLDHAGPVQSAITAAPPGDALAALDTGDAQLGKAISQLRRVLGHQLPILLQGENGTGKSVLARAVHEAGPRHRAAFIAVNCAALAEPQLEAELFGHATGDGRICEASGGTLFLDDVSALPLALQSRLLRVFEEKQVARIGGRAVPVDIRLITASAADLPRCIESGTFRADLYYHLGGLAVTLPPLRARTDMAVLIARILAGESRASANELKLSPALGEALARHRWPGNLRQLAGWLRTARLMLDEGETEITLAHLGDDARRELAARHTVPPLQGGASLRAQSDAMIASAVAAAGGNIAAAARHLGISRNTLYRRLAGRRGH